MNVAPGATASTSGSDAAVFCPGCGLITKERRGREQLVHTDLDAVRRARQALDRLETAWRGRVDRMSDLLAQDTGTEESPTRGQRR